MAGDPGEDAVLIFIAPPDPAILRERLATRGTDSADAIERRLETAKQELEAKVEFPHVVCNDDLDEAVDELEGDRPQRVGRRRFLIRTDLAVPVRTLEEEWPQLAQKGVSRFDDVAPRVAAKVVPAGVGGAFAAPILLPGVPGRVIGVAVEFDRQPMLGPATVDAPPAGRSVGDREREARVSQKTQKARLQFGEDDPFVASQDRARSCAAPRLVGRRARTASTSAGVVRCRMPAS